MSDDRKAPFDAAAYWNKRYATVDVTKSGHIDLPAAYNVWLYRRKQAQFARAMKACNASLKGARLLEVAAGTGAWMDFWESQGVEDYLGIDLSQNAINELNSQYPSRRFLLCDLNEPGLLSVVGGGFDCVVAIDVLYHLLDDDRFNNALHDLSCSLKPGGLLVLHDIFLPREPVDHRLHIRWRTLAQFETAFDEAGLEIIYRRPTFLFMVQNASWKGLRAKALDGLWRAFSYPLISRLPRVAGALGCFADSLACRFMTSGPSMEFVICRKMA